MDLQLMQHFSGYRGHFVTRLATGKVIIGNGGTISGQSTDVPEDAPPGFKRISLKLTVGTAQ